MVIEDLVVKAVNLPEKEKARAWNYLMGYYALHMITCTDDDCLTCRGVKRTMNEGLEGYT